MMEQSHDERGHERGHEISSDLVPPIPVPVEGCICISTCAAPAPANTQVRQVQGIAVVRLASPACSRDPCRMVAGVS